MLKIHHIFEIERGTNKTKFVVEIEGIDVPLSIVLC